MITIREIITRMILETPFLEEGLAEGIINLSALARKIKPQIEGELLKPVSESAVLMALKRTLPSVQLKNDESGAVSKDLSDITVRSGLSEYTYLKSRTILKKRLNLMRELEDRHDYFITFTQGIHEITTILNASLNARMKEIFKGEKLISRMDGLAAITLQLTDEMVYMPGIHYNILKQLAWYKINVVEVVSTFTEFNIIIEKEQVDRSFSLLLKYLHKS